MQVCRVTRKRSSAKIGLSDYFASINNPISDYIFLDKRAVIGIHMNGKLIKGWFSNYF
jgi:hypothetical protein